MALDTNFNVNPYYDDFDEDKKYLRLLFKPGYAVQARELTQIQTILQKQVERFGNHIFQNGSVVTGGQSFFQNVKFLKLETSFGGVAVDINDFVGKTIVDNISIPTKRAEVIKVYDADAGTGDPKTLLVKEIYGTFNAGEIIKTFESAQDTVSATIAAGGTGTGQTFSIDDGVYFYDGFFVKSSAQTIATSKYTTASNVRVGFEITETIVSSSSDTSLLDPALDASNYQAPGSDRFKIDLVLSTRSLSSTDDTKFIEISRIENGEVITLARYPQYSVIEDTLARRTYDESGNYTVKPFRMVVEESTANSANMVAVISPGKAYVYGYEFETISPTRLIVPKPRTTTAVTNKRITTDYGYYVYANTLYGTFPINSLATVDLHCVSNSLINVSTTATVSNTKVGTARVKSIAFDSAANTSNSSTYEYKLFLFDVDVGSLTGTVNSAINISTVQIANTLISSSYAASSNNAYVGAKFRITSGPGTGELPKTITNYNWLNQTVELSEPFTATLDNSSAWSIDFEFNDVKSLAVINGTTRVAAADIDDRSKDYASPYGDTFISDTTLEPLLFRIGENFIANSTIADVTMSHRRLYESQTFATSQSPALSVGTGETLASGSSTSSRQDNYMVVVTAAGTSPYKVGQIIPADLFTVDTSTRKITVTNGNNMTANIIATIDAGTPTQKTKTYNAGNNQILVSGGVNLFGNGSVQLFAANGQVHISANSVVKTPSTAQSLYMPDVVSLISVLDFNGNQISVSNASSAIDVTSKYTLDNGQRDSYYDHASIKLKSGVVAPKGPLAVKVNKFDSSGAGYFTVDSYNGYNYSSIPSYTSSSGIKYELRDVFDFRPVRSAATAATANSVVFDVDSSTTGPKIPENGSDIILDYSYYLPRNDKIVLNKNRTFELVTGVPSLTPQIPKDKDGAMTLFTLESPAYVLNVSNVSTQTESHKRYRMRDIGTIEKRVESLEYYTSLTFSELQALNQQDLTILDSQNVPRAKNGILVDSFVGHSVADVFKLDYKASIDRIENELRPSFNIASYSLEFDAANSSGISQNGFFVTTTTSLATFIDQPRTSGTVNINPFNVVSYLGKVELSPTSDVWVDTLRNPSVIINNENNNDVWEQINNTPWEFEWGAWETVWSTTSSRSRTTTSTQSVQSFSVSPITTFTTRRRRRRRTTTEGQVRTGVVTRLVGDTVLQSLGDRILDLSIIPFMRAKTVIFVGSSFAPNTTLYSFFDGIAVENYTARANKFVFANNNLLFKTTIGDFESANVTDNVTLTTNGSFNIIKTSNTRAFVTDVNATTGFRQNRSSVVGSNTGTVATITSYEHYSGFVSGADSSTITLAPDAGFANNITDYNASVIFIVSGEGAGQSATIQSYDPVTRNVTISGTWTTTPISANSIYSIGRLVSDEAGSIAGTFYVPTSTFRTGEKRFRLIDNNTNDTFTSLSNGDTRFFAQGTLQTVQEEILSTVVPRVERTEVTEERTITTSRSSSRSTTAITSVAPPPIDPIAQTFFVDGQLYPDGIFIDRIRVCFRSKDDTVPVTLQLRPTVNGYPSSSTVYADVTLTPDRVNITTSPDLDNPTKYTDFIFDQPVYLEPNEYSFVLLANSNKYFTYYAETGAFDLVTGRLISEQPYIGSFFKSQNAYTWTAEQTFDMMFRVIRNTFSTTTGVAQFNLIPPSANVPFDLIRPIIGEFVIGNTSIVYEFNSTVDGTGASAGYKVFDPVENYEMTDGFGRRVITSSPSSFKIRASLTTLSSAISPAIDIDRVSVVAIGNIINNLPLRNADVVVASSGSGYANSSDVTVTISGGGGSGATAVANVVANTIDAVYIIDGGSGYTTSPIITITPGSGGGSGASVTYNGEDKKSGGNSDVRYMTRQVTLADGFDSGDLRVYMNAYKPSGSNILVYYKILSKSDPDLFDDKNYQLMTELGNENFVSSNPDDYRDLVFSPGSGGSANNSVNYVSGSTSYSTFRTFAIKIVMSGTTTVDVPIVSDLRIIALPAG